MRRQLLAQTFMFQGSDKKPDQTHRTLAQRPAIVCAFRQPSRLKGCFPMTISHLKINCQSIGSIEIDSIRTVSMDADCWSYFDSRRTMRSAEGATKQNRGLRSGRWIPAITAQIASPDAVCTHPPPNARSILPPGQRQVTAPSCCSQQSASSTSVCCCC